MFARCLWETLRKEVEGAQLQPRQRPAGGAAFTHSLQRRKLAPSGTRIGRAGCARPSVPAPPRPRPRPGEGGESVITLKGLHRLKARTTAPKEQGLLYCNDALPLSITQLLALYC